jgi:hypothetical protein
MLARLVAAAALVTACTSTVTPRDLWREPASQVQYPGAVVLDTWIRRCRRLGLDGVAGSLASQKPAMATKAVSIRLR